MELDHIHIPAASRGLAVNALDLPIRLRHVLEAEGIRLVGELHGKSYAEVEEYPNCGRKSIIDLQTIVRQLQSGTDVPENTYRQSAPANTGTLVVPPQAHDLKLTELPLSVRLENTLRRCGYRSLGDLTGVAVKDLLKVKNCGRRCIVELRYLIVRAGEGEFSVSVAGDIASNLREVACSIDSGLARLSPRDRMIIEARLFGNKGCPRTLEDVAVEYTMTRERVRQIVKNVMRTVRKEGGPRFVSALEAVTRQCELHVIPLTPELFAYWIREQSSTLAYTPQFYVRFLDVLEQTIPAWPAGFWREARGDCSALRVEQAIERWISQSGAHPSLCEAYAHLREQKPFRKLRVDAFLSIVRKARKVIVDFTAPDLTSLRLRRLRIVDFARAVLENTQHPLTPDDIIARAKAKYGEEAIVVSVLGARNSLTPDQGFFLLGPRLIGIRKHFHTPEKCWPKLCDQFAKLLRVANRPVSTVEAGTSEGIQGFERTNPYEMAQILREDKRFTDLGRQLFCLKEWQIEERDHIKDLLPRVFTAANHVLTLAQIQKRLACLRSVSPYSIAGIVQTHPEICSFGFGYYGLKGWGNLQKEVILTDREAIERAVRRAPPPATFSGVCEAFGVPVEGARAAVLWKTCAGSSRLRRSPDRQSAETLLLHKSVSLEQALCSIARVLQRPAVAYELQWELISKFGELFSHVSLSDIDQRLKRSHLFLRNATGAYMLDADFDLADFDLDALRAACRNILHGSNGIATCDELIERLELAGFTLDEFSSDMLACALRGAEGLQEVGHQRFRAR